MSHREHSTKGWSLTTSCFELHRSWLRLRTASAAKLALCSSLLAGIRSVLASTAHQRAIQDVSDARDDLADAFLELRIEARATIGVTLRALRYTLRWLPSSLHQVWIDKGVPSTSPASRALGASLSLGRPEYFDASGQMGRSSGWTIEDLRQLRSSPHIYGYPQRFVVGSDQPIDSKEWLEAITTWPNPFVMQGESEILTIEGTGEPWVAPEKWDAAKVSEAEGWNRNPIGYTITDPELYELESKLPPLPRPPLLQFPRADPVNYRRAWETLMVMALRTQEDFPDEDLGAAEAVEGVQG